MPNWKISYEMAEPRDRFYNTERLIGAGIKEEIAKEIADMIYQITLVL